MAARHPGGGYPARATVSLSDLPRVPKGPAPGATPVRCARCSTVERQRDMATDQRNDAYRIVEEARLAAERLLRMEREHTGSGREGHLSERDLAPLLHALQIDPEEKQ